MLLQLLPQAIDIDVDILEAILISWAPGSRQDLLVRTHPARTPQQVGQQPVLRGRHVDRLAADLDLPPLEVNA
jgi:hypothetical protein